MDPEKQLEEAWVGDAVLSLFARQWILAEGAHLGEPRHDLFRDMTSNQFLSACGQPTAVEAEIGRRYQDEGLVAAFGHIEQKLLPVFLKQHHNRRRGRRPGG